MGLVRSSCFVGISVSEYQWMGVNSRILNVNFRLCPCASSCFCCISSNFQELYLPLMNLHHFRLLRSLVALCLTPVLVVPACFAWGKDGHKMINYLAVTSL